MANARTVGERIEELLAGLQAGRDKDTAEELVRLLVEMYGEGLSRVLAVLEPPQVTALVEDELVESLLLLHDLHPVDVDGRIQRALDRVRPYLGSHSGGVEYLGVDDDGVAHLRLEGSCDGCASSALTVRTAIEGAIQDAAPELTGIEVAGVPAATPVLQVGMGPPAGWHEPVPTAEGAWTTLPDFGRTPAVVSLEGTPVLVCSVRGTHYAYRDACAACGSTLASAALSGTELTCVCGARFDVRLAGRGVDSALHLDPLPLLADAAGVRVALSRTVAS